MKHKQIYIVVALSIVMILAIVTIIIPKRNLNTNTKNIIGEEDITKKSYGYPLIKLASYNIKEIEVDAGIYRFGDIDQDGIVGQEDLTALKIMIQNNNIGFTKGQIDLADVNEDGNIDNQDIELFINYLNKNGDVKYSIHSDLLLYCFNKTNNSDTCTWQQESKYVSKDIRDYYIFVKQTNNNRISDSMKLEMKDTSKYDEG